MDVSSIMANLQATAPNAGRSAQAISPLVNAAATQAAAPHAMLPDRVEFGGTKDFLGNMSFDSRLWDRPYSVEDAIDQAWQDAAMPIDVFGLRDTPTTGMSRDEYIQYRRELGQDAAIDWGRLEHDFSMPANNYASADNALDYFAARYVTLKDRIMGMSDKEKSQAELGNLDRLFGDSIKKLADSMSTKLEESLAGYGLSGEKENFYQSLLANFDGKTKEYAAMMKRNPDVAGLSGTGNEWLATDDRFMADALRSAKTEAPKATQKSDGPTATRSTAGLFDVTDAAYTGREMSALNSVLVSMKQSERYINAAASEEEVGFVLGSMAAKLTVASDYAAFGDKMGALTDKLFSGYVNKYIADSNASIDEVRNDKRPMALDHSGEAYYDADAIMKIVEQMKTAAESGTSLEQLLRDGASAGRDVYLQRKDQYDTELRYQNEISNFWKYYNQPGPMQKYGAPTISTNERMLADWKSFLGVLTGAQTKL